MLSVAKLSVVMLNIVMLNVVEPEKKQFCSRWQLSLFLIFFLSCPRILSVYVACLPPVYTSINLPKIWCLSMASLSGQV
jgi:hypothetical protein